MTVSRTRTVNRVVSNVVAALDNVAPKLMRYREVRKAVYDFSNKLDRQHSESSVLCNECCKVASYVGRKKSLDLKTCTMLFNVIADVLWYLGVSSRKLSHKAARTLVYEMTYTNWSKLNRPEGYLNNVDAESLYDKLTSDLTYFSDRWSFNRLLRLAYTFADVLVQEKVDVYSLCNCGRFNRVQDERKE